MAKNTQETDSFGILSTSVSNAPLGDDYLNSILSNDVEDIEPITKKPAQQQQQKGVIKPTTEEEEEEEDPQQVQIEESEDFLGGLDKKKRKDDSRTPEQKAADKQAEEAGETEEEQSSEEEEELIPSFSKDLFASGIFTRDEDEEEALPEINTQEELFERFNHEKRKGSVQILENILSNFGDDYREAFNAIYLNGVSPKDYFGHMHRMENIGALDVTIVENQKSILREHYRSQGWDDNKISAKIERFETIGELENEATDAQQTLVQRETDEINRKKEKAQSQLIADQQEEQDFQNSVLRILNDKLKSKEFDGLPIDQKLASQVAGYLTEKKWKLPDGKKISDFDKELLDLGRPENRELKIKYATLFQLIKQDPTLSRLKKNAVAKETNVLFRSLQRDKVTAKKQGKTVSNFFED
jgi:hypothetical protein